MASALERAARAAFEAAATEDVYAGGFKERVRRDQDWLDDPEPKPTLTLIDGDIDFEAVARAVLMAVRDLGEAECERVRGYFPCQDIMADTLFSLSIDAILNEKDATND